VTTQRRALLLVKHRIPYPIEIGSDAVSYAIIRALAGSFDLTVVGVDSGQRSEAGAANLRSLGIETVLVPPYGGLGSRSGPVGSIVRNGRLLLLGMPRLLQSQACHAFSTTLSRLSSERDFALAMFENWTTVPYSRYVTCPTALLNHDAWHLTIQGVARYEPSPIYRALWKLEARAIQRFETQAQAKFDWSLFLSEEDRKIISGEAQADRVRVIPVPFPFEPKPAGVGNVPLRQTVVFVGAMNVDFNIDGVCYFVDRIWPSVHERAPDAEFLVIGRHPTERVRALERVPGVRITGEAFDIDAILHESTVAVSPTRFGTGIKVKVAQALAAGLPVVGTPAGLSGFSHADCLIRTDNERTFADEVVHLLVDQDHRRSMAEASAHFYREHLWVKAAGPRLVSLFDEMIAVVHSSPTEPSAIA
jgi:glycosyltransferase involved in cell wall biosynthesis